MLTLTPTFESAARTPQSTANWPFWWALLWLVMGESDREREAARQRRNRPCPRAPRPRPPAP